MSLYTFGRVIIGKKTTTLFPVFGIQWQNRTFNYLNPLVPSGLYMAPSFFHSTPNFKKGNLQARLFVPNVRLTRRRKTLSFKKDFNLYVNLTGVFVDFCLHNHKALQICSQTRVLTMGQSQTMTVSTTDINDLGDAELLDEPGPQRSGIRWAAAQARATTPGEHLGETNVCNTVRGKHLDASTQ